MIEDAAFSWDTILSIVVSLIVIVGSVGGVWYKLHASIAAEKEARLLGNMAMRAEIDAFKERVAREYATNSAIQQVEERVVQAIERLGDRLDRFLERGPRAR